MGIPIPIRQCLSTKRCWVSHINNIQLTDTVARPGTEGHIRIWMSACGVVQVETLRVKLLGVREIMWVFVQLGRQNSCRSAAGNHIVPWKRNIRFKDMAVSIITGNTLILINMYPMRKGAQDCVN